MNPQLYTPTKRRYENPDAVCDICGVIIGINEENHKLGYCRAGYLSTPIPSKDFEFSQARYKRIRTVALYDYPPWYASPHPWFLNLLPARGIFIPMNWYRIFSNYLILKLFICSMLMAFIVWLISVSSNAFHPDEFNVSLIILQRFPNRVFFN